MLGTAICRGAGCHRCAVGGGCAVLLVIEGFLDRVFGDGDGDEQRLLSQLQNAQSPESASRAGAMDVWTARQALSVCQHAGQ